MNTPPTDFSQIMDFLLFHDFRKCVRRYRENFRDIESCFER